MIKVINHSFSGTIDLDLVLFLRCANTDARALIISYRYSFFYMVGW